ncbi:glycosyltransferase family 2 protein [Bacillus sp. AGMB 02131]|uniref:Glycosyltransferase family 2 protein n=1 Tax=Peribacillus faecalis TaxID=2772559 RepID=A0A927CZ35_9BACI|nr:glycosyltransferase family 2 protein [Peribacillus faecalis]MBD3109661.1 glycosyltransferase family 2 protein [Peribacillus faecalis]
MAKVSIIMTSYNKPQYVGNSINAILNQTYKNFELIIMDDNSNEETIKAIKPYLNDARVKFFRSNIQTMQQRVEKTRYAVLINEALTKCTGKYISYATDDNCYRPDRLEKMVKFLEKYKRINIVYSASTVRYINLKNEVTKTLVRATRGILSIAPCVVDHCSIMHRRTVLPVIKKRFGSYWDENPEFYRIGDARFFWRLNHFWDFHPINETLDDNYMTELSIHYKLDKEQESEFVRLLPKQRTCRELREYLRLNKGRMKRGRR